MQMCVIGFHRFEEETILKKKKHTHTHKKKRTLVSPRGNLFIALGEKNQFQPGSTH